MEKESNRVGDEALTGNLEGISKERNGWEMGCDCGGDGVPARVRRLVKKEKRDKRALNCKWSGEGE